MATPTDTGKAFLAGVLAKLPESLRTQAEATFAAAEAESALAELGSGVLRQADYSRAQDGVRARETELNTWHQQLADWQAGEREKVAAAIAAADARVAAGPTAPIPSTAPTPAQPPVNAITREDLNSFGDLAAGVIAVTTRLGLQHMHTFGEVMDPQQLLSHPKVREIGLEGAYKELFKEKLDQKAAELDAVKAKAIGDAAVAAYRAAHPNLPYPVNGQVQPSTLDFLESKADPSQFTAEAAANHYNQLVAARTGVS